MEDIARRAGVSKVAVSYALNDRPGVSPGTRAEIKRIAREIGWRPNSAARALTRARADAVGLVSSRPAQLLGAEPFFMGLISGMQDELAVQGKALTLQFVADAGQEMEVHRRWWGEGRVDGVLLTDLRADDPRIALVRELGLPAVAIGHPEAAAGLPAVWSDDAAALAQTLRYLHALGHRSVARVAGLRSLDHTERRDRAHRAVCAELGMAEPAIVHTDYSGEEGARAARSLLIGPGRPTAIVFDNDIMAVAGLSVADELGLRVPGELSLVAWDDSQLTRVVRPGITALNRDIPAYGRHAVRALLTLVEEGWAEGLEDEPARLLPRGSTAVAPTPTPQPAHTGASASTAAPTPAGVPTPAGAPAPHGASVSGGASASVAAPGSAVGAVSAGAPPLAGAPGPAGDVASAVAPAPAEAPASAGAPAPHGASVSAGASASVAAPGSAVGAVSAGAPPLAGAPGPAGDVAPAPAPAPAGASASAGAAASAAAPGSAVGAVSAGALPLAGVPGPAGDVASAVAPAPAEAPASAETAASAVAPTAAEAPVSGVAPIPACTPGPAGASASAGGPDRAAAAERGRSHGPADV